MTISDEQDIPPLDAKLVLRRAFVMCALVCRGSIESGAGHPEAESLHKRILEWLTRMGLWNQVEPSEEKMLHSPLGGLAPKEVIRATWYAEGLAVLAWASNRLDRLPNHDEKVDPFAVTDSLLFLGDDAAEVISKATLRSPAELEACRELLYAIHARLRDFARNRGHQNFTSWVEKAWITTLKLDAAHLIVHDDLAIDNKAIGEVEGNRLQECEWVTCERRRAIIWLFGGHTIYSQIPVDT
jgi:Domain of unknown function (DUF4272)